MELIPKSIEDQIQHVIQQKVTENFQERDQLLLDLLQGMEHLNEMADTTKNTTKSYPSSLKNKTTTTTTAINRQRKLEEILDTPHSVHAVRGGWWSVDLRRKKGELKIYQERGVAKGSDCISIGRTIKKSR